MAHRKKNRNVGVIGVGQTKHSSHREDVNQPEMIHEAVREALDDAGLKMDDIDCLVHGNMELFEMIHQPDLWHQLGTGALRQEHLPPHDGWDDRCDPLLCRGQPCGIGYVRHGHGDRVRETPGGAHHRRHHEHGRPPLVPQSADRARSPGRARTT